MLVCWTDVEYSFKASMILSLDDVAMVEDSRGCGEIPDKLGPKASSGRGQKVWWLLFRARCTARDTRSRWRIG